MKAAVTSDMVTIMLVILTIFAFFTLIMPGILSMITEAFSKSSGEAVARQLSGLITISGASAHEIKIDYIPTKEFVYKISIKDRSIKVTPRFKVSYAEKASSTQQFAIGLNNFDQDDVNHFVVEKNFDGASNYVFKAAKE